MFLRKIYSRLLKEELELINEYRTELRLKSAEIDSLKKSIGRLHAQINRSDLNTIKRLEEYEFQVYSQWGDDGIIQFLVNYLDIEEKRFVEFGVENYTECNTRFLLTNNNWSGLIMDGSDSNMARVRNENLYWQYDLTAIATFVTAENINDLLKNNKFTGNLGLLHIDIDGNDYWIWDVIRDTTPVIVIVEYNSLFGYENPWTIPYQKDFVRSKAHYSNLYYGVSLLSLCDLAEKKGYAFIGCNSNGNNAYFVRKDKLKQLKPLTAAEGYVLSKFSESRDQTGKLTFERSADRLRQLRGLPVYNTRTQQIENIG